MSVSSQGASVGLLPEPSGDRRQMHGPQASLSWKPVLASMGGIAAAFGAYLHLSAPASVGNVSDFLGKQVDCFTKLNSLQQRLNPSLRDLLADSNYKCEASLLKKKSVMNYLKPDPWVETLLHATVGAGNISNLFKILHKNYPLILASGVFVKTLGFGTDVKWEHFKDRHGYAHLYNHITRKCCFNLGNRLHRAGLHAAEHFDPNVPMERPKTLLERIKSPTKVDMRKMVLAASVLAAGGICLYSYTCLQTNAQKPPAFIFDCNSCEPIVDPTCQCPEVEISEEMGILKAVETSLKFINSALKPTFWIKSAVEGTGLDNTLPGKTLLSAISGGEMFLNIPSMYVINKTKNVWMAKLNAIRQRCQNWQLQSERSRAE